VPEPLIIPESAPNADERERLSLTELAYHRQVMEQAALLPVIDQQVATLQAQRLGIVGARDSWMRFQKDARGLDDGDTIDGDGYVFRQAAGGMTVPDGDGPHEGGVSG
jgi:hypothetical protein